MIPQPVLTFIGNHLPRWTYAEWLKETHINRTARLFNRELTYLEIGVRDGSCFRQIRVPRKIGVDPCRQGFGAERPGETFCEMPSDDFFRDVAPEMFRDSRIDIALADGLHEFQQTLTDILNIERYTAEDGVIFVHDCNPALETHAGPEVPGTVWNGDVWKVGHYLRKHRPDLDFFTLDCSFGVMVITGINHDPPPVSDTGIVESKSLEYAYLRNNRKAVLNLVHPLRAAVSLKKLLYRRNG